MLHEHSLASLLDGRSEDFCCSLEIVQPVGAAVLDLLRSQHAADFAEPSLQDRVEFVVSHTNSFNQ